MNSFFFVKFNKFLSIFKVKTLFYGLIFAEIFDMVMVKCRLFERSIPVLCSGNKSFCSSFKFCQFWTKFDFIIFLRSSRNLWKLDYWNFIFRGLYIIEYSLDLDEKWMVGEVNIWSFWPVSWRFRGTFCSLWKGHINSVEVNTSSSKIESEL